MQSFSTHLALVNTGISLASSTVIKFSTGLSAQHSVRCSAQMTPRQLRILEDVTLSSAHHQGLRLDAVVSELFPQRFGSATGVKRAIRRKEIRLNGSLPRTDSIVQLGDNLQVVVKLGSAPIKPHAFVGKEGLGVVYEDDHFACVIKPQGIPTQGKGEGSVQGRVKYCLQHTHLPEALFRPHQVHRLDAGTGGLVLVAKTRAAVAALGTDLAAHNMQKRYLALVIGRLEGGGIVNHALQGKPAISIYSAVQHCPSVTFGWLTWVSLWPKTGRTHQLRKHMAYIGHPVLGDMQYKHHRKPDCQAVQVADAQQYVPQLRDLKPEVMPEQQARMAAAAQTSAVQAAVVQLQLQQQPGHAQQQAGSHSQHQQKEGQADQSMVFRIEAMAAGGSLNSSTQPLFLQAVERQIALPPGSQNSVADDPFVSCSDVAAEGADNRSSEIKSNRPTNDVSVDADVHNVDDSGRQLNVEIVGESSDRSNGAVAGIRSKTGQLLLDGSEAPMCLWAVQLQLLHPITRDPLDLSIDTPVQLYKRICEIELPL